MKLVNDMWLPEQDKFFEHRPNYEDHDYNRAREYMLDSYRVAVDIGAHVGFWTQRLAKDYNTVLAFEPVPEHYACLNRNIEHHENVVTLNHAVGDCEMELTMQVTDSNSGMSKIDPNGELTVEVKPLDYYKLRDVDFIKIDVEGHELAVLQGAEHTIQRNRPVIFLEILNSTALPTVVAIQKFLHNAGYTMVERVAENYIYIPEVKQ